MPETDYSIFYRPADEFVVLNEGDSLLRRVVLKLPKPPDIKLIDGYGLPPHEQKFQKHEVPNKLRKLEERVVRQLAESRRKEDHPTGYKIVKLYWETFNKEIENFTEEVEYIKKVTYHLKYGYWFFNYGKPTWITPWHYMFLNFWYMEDPNPQTGSHFVDYRDVDRRKFLYKWYMYTTHETFADVDKDGYAYKVDGKFRMKKLDSKVFFGDQQPKRRRCGATMGALTELWWIAISSAGKNCTIVSMDGSTAEKAYNMLIISWQKSPMFLKPVWNGNNAPAKSIEFTSPSNVYHSDAIGSKIFWTESASETANDSDKLHGLMSDEEGKTQGVWGRWEVNKKTMHQGPDIHGWSSHPSTVEDMNESAKVYEQMWDESDFYCRLPNGQTISGLARIFFKAWDGYDGFIDKWGYSVINAPTEDQIKYAPPTAKYVSERKGAKQYIEENRDVLIKKSSESDYRKKVRKEPIDSAEAFMGDGGDIGFPMQILDSRITELKHKQFYRIGNLYENRNSGLIEWVDDPNGRFKCSKVLSREEAKMLQQTYIKRMYNPDLMKVVDAKAPIYTSRYCLGVDTFDYLVKSEVQLSNNKTQLSDGGGAVFYMYDEQVDEEKETKDYNSMRFVLTYRNRTPGTKTFHDDMLLAARYYGCLMGVEYNKGGGDLIKNTINSGYGGFLFKQIDEKGIEKDQPGIFTSRSSKVELFLAISDYLTLRGHAEKHLDFLLECKDIKRVEQMGRFDLLTAAGISLLMAKEKQLYLREKFRRKEKININNFGFQMHNY